MKKTKLSFLQLFKRNISAYSPEIMIGFGIAGFIATAIISAKSAISTHTKINRAKELIAQENGIDPDTIPNKEFSKDIIKGYAAPVILGALSTGLIIGGTSIKFKRNSALATALVVAETAAKDYHEKVVELLGEKKEEAIRKSIIEDKISSDNRPMGTRNVIITPNGDMRCYDCMSDRYFSSDIERIKRSVNELNRRMLDDMYLSLNEFYDELGLPETSIGNLLGWNINHGYIDIEYSSHLSPDGVPCLAINCSAYSQPRPDFMDI